MSAFRIDEPSALFTRFFRENGILRKPMKGGHWPGFCLRGDVAIGDLVTIAGNYVIYDEIQYGPDGYTWIDANDRLVTKRRKHRIRVSLADVRKMIERES